MKVKRGREVKVKNGSRVAAFAEATVAEERLERVGGLTQRRRARREI